jgi:hypothetical protein
MLQVKIMTGRIKRHLVVVSDNYSGHQGLISSQASKAFLHEHARRSYTLFLSFFLFVTHLLVLVGCQDMPQRLPTRPIVIEFGSALFFILDNCGDPIRP